LSITQITQKMEKAKIYGPCLKQTVTCIIVAENGTEYHGQNSCSVEDDICPRVVAGYGSGAAYELCGPPIHAEIEAISKMPKDIYIGGTAYIYGHDFFCRECQLALIVRGINEFVLGDY